MKSESSKRAQKQRFSYAWRCSGGRDQKKITLFLVKYLTSYLTIYYVCSPKSDTRWQTKPKVLQLYFGAPSESSSVGRARPCQGRGRGFEPRLSLQLSLEDSQKWLSFLFKRSTVSIS